MTDKLATVTAKETYHSKTTANNTVIIYPDKPETKSIQDRHNRHTSFCLTPRNSRGIK
jgi:hypothetical protein